MKKISIVTACYNEQDNIREFYNQVIAQLNKISGYDYEIIAIDNKSTDNTRNILKQLADEDKKFKVIFNSKNFGPLKSPFFAMQHATGDCMIYMAADLQDSPELIPAFLKKWEEGFKIAVAIKNKSKESKRMWILRQSFYKFINVIKNEDSVILENFTGYGLYDKCVVDLMRTCDDPNPYIKSFISDIGFDIAKIEYTQPRRKHGKSKFNLFALYGYAMTIITKHSFFPIRLATFGGLILSLISLLVSLLYVLMKLLYWNEYNLGIASLVIGLFFFAAVQLFFVGIIGEYIVAIYTRVDKKPLVVVEERFNFDAE